MIKAIETSYRGYKFRSRLEARWAVFFDALGIKWDYEPEGFELPGGVRYLPDFFFQGNGHRGPWVEIKGVAPTPSEVEKLRSLCEAQGAYGILIFGEPGKQGHIEIYKEGDNLGDSSTLDVLLDIHGGPGDFNAAIGAARSARFEFGAQKTTNRN